MGRAGLELGKTPHSLEGYREMTILLSWDVEAGGLDTIQADEDLRLIWGRSFFRPRVRQNSGVVLEPLQVGI